MLAGVRHGLWGNCANSASMFRSKLWKSTGYDPRNHPRRRGRRYERIMSGTLYPSISLWYQPLDLRCYSTCCCSRIIAVSSCTSMLKSTRPPSGPVNRSLKYSRELRRQSIYCAIEMRSIGASSRGALKSMVIVDVLTASRSSWQNAFVERVIGSIRRDCLDHVIVLNECHLKRILTHYLDYYHSWRTHLSLEMDCPESRLVQPPSLGKVVEFPEVGGLHHHYVRLAA